MAIRSTWWLGLLIFACLWVQTDAAELTCKGFVEVAILGFGLFYLDLVTDLWSLARFYRRGQFWFLGMNLCGLFMNMLISAFCGVYFGGYIKACGGGTFDILVGFFLGLTQTHVLAMTLAIVVACDRTPKILHTGKDVAFTLAMCKVSELFEATVSTAVQGYDLVWDVDLSNQDEMQLRVSVLLSLMSMANGLTLLDKGDLGAGSLAVITGVFSIDFAIIFIFRLSEVVLSLGSLFLFQLAARPYGIFVAFTVLFLCSFSWVCTHLRHNHGWFAWFWNMFAPDIGLTLMTCVPLTLFYCGPVGSMPQSHLKVLPTVSRYVIARWLYVVVLLVSATLIAGSMQNVWQLWLGYTQSAVDVAYAVGVAFLSYPTMYGVLRYRYAEQAKYELLSSR